MKTTGDQFLMKQINKSLVLEMIRTKSPISRAKISEITGLNKATVSSLVTELIESNLVYEIGHGKSSGGRKPVMLVFHNRAGFAVGVDLGVNYILTVLTDLQGNRVNEIRISLSDRSFEQVLSILLDSINTMIDQAPPSPYGVVGIGLGIPGIVNEEGVILYAPNLEWENIDLESILQNHYQVPVYIDNEANAGALGEKSFGAGRGIAHLLYVSIGMGIGTGIVINNQLYKGANGFSGEFGHTVIETNGLNCKCGNKGCWEMYASESALLQSADRLLDAEDQSTKSSLEEIIKMAEQEQPQILKILQQTGESIGIGLINMLNIFNPDLILIGNRLSSLGKWIQDPILNTMEKRSRFFYKNQCRIAFSSLGIYSCAFGAASFAIEGFFNNLFPTLSARDSDLNAYGAIDQHLG